MLRQSRPGRVKQRFWRFFVHISTSGAKLKICNNVFCAWMCRSGVPSFSTIDQTMKMLGAKAFWEVFRIFFFFWRNFFKWTISKDEVQKDKQSWKFEVKIVKNKGAVSKNVRSCRDHSTLPLMGHFTWLKCADVRPRCERGFPILLWPFTQVGILNNKGLKCKKEKCSQS